MIGVHEWIVIIMLLVVGIGYLIDRDWERPALGKKRKLMRDERTREQWAKRERER